MTADPIRLPQTKTVKDAATIMAENEISALPVVDENDNLVGIITESDFIGKEVEIPHAMVTIREIFNESYRHQDIEDVCAKVKNKPLSDVMTKSPKTMAKDQSLDELVRMMAQHDLKRVPICDNGKLVGIVTRKDIVKAFAK